MESFFDCTEKQSSPECIKVAKVLPLFKKCDESLPCNHRPITFLSSLSKVFEKLLCTRMVKFLNKNNLFTPAQYGLKPNHSRAHAITEITDFIRGENDKNSKGIASFIDLQKAFDSLDRAKTVSKIMCSINFQSIYEFRGPLFEITVDYLSCMQTTICICK